LSTSFRHFSALTKWASICTVNIFCVAWHRGHRVHQQNRISRVRIPPGCKVFRNLYIAVFVITYVICIEKIKVKKEKKELHKIFCTQNPSFFQLRLGDVSVRHLFSNLFFSPRDQSNKFIRDKISKQEPDFRGQIVSGWLALIWRQRYNRVHRRWMFWSCKSSWNKFWQI
jgi:hypothetical protein